MVFFRFIVVLLLTVVKFFGFPWRALLFDGAENKEGTGGFAAGTPVRGEAFAVFGTAIGTIGMKGEAGFVTFDIFSYSMF